MALLALDQVTLDTFAPLVNQVFTADFADGARVEFTLYAANALPSHDYPGKQRDPFELRFSAPTEAMLPQGIYELKNETLGVAQLFLVPIRPEDDHFAYQAVFN